MSLAYMKSDWKIRKKVYLCRDLPETFEYTY